MGISVKRTERDAQEILDNWFSMSRVFLQKYLKKSSQAFLEEELTRI